MFTHPYDINPAYSKKVAYFSMEFGIDQSFKIYSGGLGYLAGSHMRSAYAMRQNMIGIGVLWKYGYYDQVRQGDQSMSVLFQEKMYSFLEDPGIEFEIPVNHHTITVKAYYLHPDTFGTAPMYFLTTDIDANDYLAQTISHRLYDSNVSAKIAQYVLLGIGGVKLLEEIGWEADIYHFNEAHALPAAYYLYDQVRDLEKLREKVVVTTHTPVPAGNEVHNVDLLHSMSFFNGMSREDVEEVAIIEHQHLNLTANALHVAKLANGVSKMHGEVARRMWSGYDDICPILHITNAQNFTYWHDEELWSALEADNDKLLWERKKALKEELFEVVADQCGKHFSPDVLTMVWARRYAGYKRADMLTKDIERFEKMLEDEDRPVQLIWAGKPYPGDNGAIDVFNKLVYLSKHYDNCAVLTGYELQLSKKLKQGSDIWLNTPRITREASGTSGMTAAMNGSVNCSTQDGWIPEFAEDGVNAFLLPELDAEMPVHELDWRDMNNLYDVLEKKVLPAYYDKPEKWLSMVKQSMRDVVKYFDSDRMAREYYEKLYNPGGTQEQRENVASAALKK